MYRKLVINGVCILALVTLVVSAQEPRPADPSREQPLNRGDRLPRIIHRDALLGQVAPDYPDGRLRRDELELAQQSEKLVKQLAKAEGENKDQIKAQLTETLGKQFDARQKRHQAEIAALETQVKKLKELVQKRQENRRDIISKRREQLVREAEGLGW